MAVVNFNFESQYLTGNTQITVIMPDKPRTIEAADFYTSGKKYKVLWLLHGTFGDHSDWMRHTMIESYARKRELIVVSFSAFNSNYSNWTSFATGYNVYDYLFEELMPIIYNWFPASSAREDNFIAGLSMGGFGVTLYAFNHPEKFAGAAILSSFARVINEDNVYEGRNAHSIRNYNSVEEFIHGYENTYEALEKKLAEGASIPKLFLACGEADFLYDQFLKFKDYIQSEKRIESKVLTVPGLKHEWKLWDIAILEALEYFGIKQPENSTIKF